MMRPLQLELENIGPFVERTIVDFGHFGPSSLFLICGRTGSGKSFLFDSICYALYGQTPSAREANLRSDHSRETDRPTIRFSFSLGGDAYEVERTLPYKEVKQRGTGLKEVGETQCLRRLAPVSEVLSTKKTEVNKDCKELIQLELEQFSRVMMIPQGEFRELLRADTERREKLLRKLFRSELYLDLTNGIDGKFKELNGRYLDLRKETGTLLSQFADRVPRKEEEGPDEVRMEDILTYKEGLGKQLAPSREEVKKHSEEYERSRLDTRWMEDALRLDRTQKELAEEIKSHLLTGRDQIGPLRKALEKHELANELSPFLKLLAQKGSQEKRTKEAQVENARELGVCKLELAKAEKEMGTLPALKTRYETILSNQGRLDTLLKDMTRSRDIRKELAVSEKGEKELDRELSVSKTKEKKLSEELKSLSSELSRLSEPVTDIGTSFAKKVVVQDLKDVLEKRARLKPKLYTLEKQLASWEGEVRALKNRLEGLKRLREGSLAYELAAGLRSGEACPVCGSVGHPRPAEPPEGIVTKEEIGANEADLEKGVKELDRLKAGLVKERTEIEGYEQRMGEMVARYPELSGLDVPSLKAMEDGLERAMEAERERSARSEDLKKMQTEMNGRSAELVEERSRKQVALETLRVETGAVRKQLKELSDKADGDLQALSGLFPGETDPIKLVKAANDEKESLPRRIEAVEGKFKQASDSILKLISKGEQVQSDLQNAQRELEKLSEELSMKMAEPRYAIFMGRSEIEGSILDDDALMGNRARITSYESELSRLKGRLEQTEKDLKAHLGAAVMPSKEKLEVQKEAESTKKASLEEARSKLSTLEHEVKELEKALKRVGDITRAMADMEPDLVILKELSEQVKGLGRPRLSLERFFLAQRFEEVLMAANTRLSKLSEGRFHLRREEEGMTGGQSRAGLDIVVFDNLTGTERPASSMSGGQMFLASLALALGLADVVQARSGGIRMDALFIDEGFGSLDEETLQLALKVLMELRSDRMVGVISHVQELRRQIPQRIEVVPATVGSRIRINT